MKELHTGWSTTKTTPGPLEPNEKDAIIKVIQRNEQLEVAERQRVGKLVDRVDKIKQRAAECGPRCCRLCGQGFSLLGPSKLICEDCRKPVCSKCSIELHHKTASNISRDIWLCKICSETREMWKKTGAWFYKGIPKYELPSASTTAAQLPITSLSTPSSPMQRSTLHKNNNISISANSVMKPPRKKPINSKKVTKLGMRIDDSSSSEEENDEIDGDSAVDGGDGNETDSNNLKVSLPPSQPQNKSNNFESFKLRNGNVTISNTVDDLSLVNNKNKLPQLFTNYNRQNSSIDFQHEQQQINSGGPNPNNDWDTISMTGSIRKENGGHNHSTQHLHYNNSNNNSFRRGSVSSMSWSMISDTSSVSGSAGACGTITCGTIQINPTTSIMRQSQICREPPLGWLELHLLYTETEHTLDCTIVRARDLPAMDNSGLADPFCKINIVTEYGTIKQKKWMQTKTVHKTINPEMNETVRFLGVEPDELGNSILYVVLLDDDKYGHDFLGAAKINLGPIYLESRRMSVPLGAEDQYSIDAVTSGPWNYGQILLSLCYNTRKRALIVLIKKCINLMAKDNNGFSDPFVKLQIKPDSHRHKKFKTSIKWRNLNPVFNEEFSFETRPNDLDKQSLILTVWDKDLGKSNDFLGSLIFGPNSKGRRLKQWKDCVRLPDCYHEQWHCLSMELPNHSSH